MNPLTIDYLSLLQNHPDLFHNPENGPIKIITNQHQIMNWQKQKRNELAERGAPLIWADIGVLYDDPYFIVIRDLVEFPNGQQNGYHRLINRAYLGGGGGGVAVLCENAGKFVLLRHFRHSTRNWHWEIPRGFGEPGVEAADQATAEIHEEIAGQISELIDLGIFYNNTGIEGHPINLFLAHMLSYGPSSSETRIEMRWVTIKELESMIASTEITDSFTIATYTRARLRCLI